MQEFLHENAHLSPYSAMLSRIDVGFTFGFDSQTTSLIGDRPEDLQSQ